MNDKKIEDLRIAKYALEDQIQFLCKQFHETWKVYPNIYTEPFESKNKCGMVTEFRIKVEIYL